jgi:hypothetical protein
VFIAGGKVKANVITTSLDDVNNVLERLHTGKVTIRAVLKKTGPEAYLNSARPRYERTIPCAAAPETNIRG